MGVETLIAASMLAGAGSDIYSANQQAKANKANLNAQQQNRADLTQRIDQQMQSGQNPFASQLQQMMAGMHPPGSSAGAMPISGVVDRYGFTNGINMANPSSIDLNSLVSPQMYQFNPLQAGSYNPSQVGADGLNIDIDQVTGTQGQNAGQDALLQMMRRDVGSGPDSFLTQNLQQLGRGDSQFDNSGLFAALQPVNQHLLDEQVAQMKGSKGSFSNLFSSKTDKQEGQMRQNFANNQALQNAQIAQQSFENAQNRRQPSLNALGGFDQQNAGMQLQAAQAAAGFGQQGTQQLLQALMANQSTGLQAALANQNAFNQAGQFNTGMQFDTNQFNANQGNIYNQLLMSMMGQAQGAQMGQNQLNAQLLGILGGVGVPQQQVSPVPDALSSGFQTAAMIPFLTQMYAQNRPSSYGNYGRSTYGSNGMFRR